MFRHRLALPRRPLLHPLLRLLHRRHLFLPTASVDQVTMDILAWDQASETAAANGVIAALALIIVEQDVCLRMEAAAPRAQAQAPQLLRRRRLRLP